MNKQEYLHIFEKRVWNWFKTIAVLCVASLICGAFGIIMDNKTLIATGGGAFLATVYVGLMSYFMIVKLIISSDKLSDNNNLTTDKQEG